MTLLSSCTEISGLIFHCSFMTLTIVRKYLSSTVELVV